MDLIVMIFASLLWMIFLASTLLLGIYGLMLAQMWRLLAVLTNSSVQLARVGQRIAVKPVFGVIGVWAASGLLLVAYYYWV